MKQENGFSLIELMVAMGIFVVAIAAASNVYLSLFQNFKTQTKMSESGLGNIAGLDMLRRDLEHAGDSLPWNIPAGVQFTEATSAPEMNLNGGTSLVGGLTTSDPPRMVDIQVVSFPPSRLSDYLTIRGVSIASNQTAQKWTHLQSGGAIAPALAVPPFVPGDDYIVVINPGSNKNNYNTLVTDSATGVWSTLFGSQGGFVPDADPQGLVNVIYGLDSTLGTSAITMAFNRADYYVSGASVPTKCAPGTGVLVKGEVNQGNGFITEYPLVDCVANMQVAFQYDTTPDAINAVDLASDTLPPSLVGTEYLNMAEQLRDQLKEVRVTILAHEGQYDPDYTSPITSSGNTIYVGDSLGQGSTFSFSGSGIGNWPNYRWKLYTVVAKIPEQLISR